MAGIALAASSKNMAGGDYIASLPGLVTLNRIGLDVANGRLWQDALKTIPVTTSGDPVYVATSSVGAIDFVCAGSSTEPTYDVDGGIGFMATDGNDIITGTPISGMAVGTGDFHVWIWVYIPTAASSFNDFLVLQPSGSRILINQNASGTTFGIFSDNAGFTTTNAAPITLNDWCLLELFRESGTVSFAINSSVTYTYSDSTSLASAGLQLLTNAQGGFRIASYGTRNVAPLAGESAAIFTIGPNGI